MEDDGDVVPTVSAVVGAASVSVTATVVATVVADVATDVATDVVATVVVSTDVFEVELHAATRQTAASRAVRMGTP